MVESTAQSGRMGTLIHRGLIPRGHIIQKPDDHEMPQMNLEWLKRTVCTDASEMYKNWSTTVTQKMTSHCIHLRLGLPDPTLADEGEELQG